MSDLPLLGVSIPTYKRPEELRKCVASIVESARGEPVVVCLVDDSADGTNDALFEDLKTWVPHLHVVRNETNLGIDGNIQKAVDVCPSRHVWLLGEDDRMRPEGISTVLAALREHPVPFLYVNYSATDNDISFIIKERSLPIKTDQTMDGETFYRSVSWSMGFIGACVIERAAWDPVDATPYLDTWFAHVGRIMESIRGREVRMLASPLILNRCGSPEAFTWTEHALDVFTGWERMTRELDRIYSAEAGRESLDAFTRAHGIGSLKFMAYLRAGRVLHARNVGELVDASGRGPGFRLCAGAIAWLPSWPWRGVRWAMMRGRRWRSPIAEAP